MLYRQMKGCKRELSILGFGCMRLPTNDDSTINETLAKKIIRYAIDCGVNYIDTAYGYHRGQSEPFVGRVLKDGYRERVNLATKLPSWLISTREDMDKYLGEQLERLQTDHIDFYLVHGLNKTFWGKLEELGVREFLDETIRDGRIKHAGFSFHDDIKTFKRIVDSYDWTFCQIQYNFLDEGFQAGTAGLHYAASRGLGVIAMEPLRGGLLSRDLPGLMEIWSKAYATRTPAEWGLRWVWNHPEITVVLSGMNAMQQVKENLGAAEEGLPESLSKEDLELFFKVRSFYRKRMKIDCSRCGYCMPCPNGVDIPECFNQYNNAFVFDAADGAKRVYTMFLSKEGYASSCKECGACVKVCPQHIAVPDKLKEVADFFGK